MALTITCEPNRIEPNGTQPTYLSRTRSGIWAIDGSNRTIRRPIAAPSACPDRRRTMSRCDAGPWPTESKGLDWWDCGATSRMWRTSIEVAAAVYCSFWCGWLRAGTPPTAATHRCTPSSRTLTIFSYLFSPSLCLPAVLPFDPITRIGIEIAAGTLPSDGNGWMDRRRQPILRTGRDGGWPAKKHQIESIFSW